MKIEWYENNLENMKINLNNDKNYIINLIKKIYNLEDDINFLNFQIKSAKKEKKDSFDSNRYKIRLKK